MYGKCTVGSGHGHNYLCEATVKGPIQRDTGIVVNLVDVKRVLVETVGTLDMSHLNCDVPELQGMVPTLEVLARLLWNRIDGIDKDWDLHRIRLHQDRYLFVDVDGEDGMVYVTRQIEFNAAHRLHSHALSDEENVSLFGKCNNPNGHGHNYRLEVTVRGAVDERTGTVISTAEMDEILESEVMQRYDHRNLNMDLEEFQNTNPTSEVFARVIWSRLFPRFKAADLFKIRLVETENNAFEYYGDTNG